MGGKRIDPIESIEGATMRRLFAGFTSDGVITTGYFGLIGLFLLGSLTLPAQSLRSLQGEGPSRSVTGSEFDHWARDSGERFEAGDEVWEITHRVPKTNVCGRVRYVLVRDGKVVRLLVLQL